MTNSSHTKGRWIEDSVSMQQSQSDREPIYVAAVTTQEDENGSCKVVAVAHGATVAECRANAAVIVRACNSYEKLLAACEKALAYLNHEEGDPSPLEVEMFDYELRTAIAEAKGTPSPDA